MVNHIYTAEFKQEAIRQITERGTVSRKYQIDWTSLPTVFISGLKQSNPIALNNKTMNYWRPKKKY